MLGETGSGWINPRFLAREETGTVTPGRLHRPKQSGYALSCIGTEPFWSLHIGDGQAVLSTPGGRPDGPAFEQIHWQAGQLQGNYSHALAVRLEDEKSDSAGWAAVRRHSRQACSDGMSDNAYPFDITLITPDGSVVHGCCRRAPQDSGSTAK